MRTAIADPCSSVTSGLRIAKPAWREAWSVRIGARRSQVQSRVRISRSSRSGQIHGLQQMTGALPLLQGQCIAKSRMVSCSSITCATLVGLWQRLPNGALRIYGTLQYPPSHSHTPALPTLSWPSAHCAWAPIIIAATLPSWRPL